MTSSFALSRHSAQERLTLTPPRQDHWLGPVGLALLAHGLLVAALTWGVGWKQDVPTPVFEAELWARLPVPAAPLAEAPPPPPPAPEPEVRPEPRPAPPPPTPGPGEAQIATQRAQQKKELEQRAAEAARQKALTEKAAADKAAADKKRALEQKQSADKKAAEDKREREAAAERQRQENIRRMLGQAGASGAPQATGTAPQSAGPSAGYGARVAARIKPNVVFTETVTGNPRAEVEVRTLPDGTIVGRRIVKSSGNTDWDEAVLKAIDRTATLPRDTDGRVPSSLIIGLRPQD
jgi:colicin import membrane protein